MEFIAATWTSKNWDEREVDVSGSLYYFHTNLTYTPYSILSQTVSLRPSHGHTASMRDVEELLLPKCSFVSLFVKCVDNSGT
jgi:predicted neuraminidase